MRKHIGFFLNIAAISLFIPGILMPMFSLNTDMLAQIGNSGISSTIVNKELSLLQTVQELWQDERLVVAALIFAFSICIPIFKTLIVTFAYFKRGSSLERRLISFVASIGKWSMADVFVVAVFLAILSTNHASTQSTESLNMFGFKLDILISSETLSQVGNGFYFFAGYCLFSLLATQITQSSLKASVNTG